MVCFSKSNLSKKEGQLKWLLLLAGLFSLTRINLGGTIAISELVAVLMAPYVFMKNIGSFKKDGLKTVLWLSFLWFLGAIVSDIYSHNTLKFAMKGIATPIVYMSCIICAYAMLKDDVRKVKWFVLGVALSYIVSTFIFQRASAIGQEAVAEHAFEATIGYKLYWVDFVDHFALLPIRGWYLTTPWLYSVLAAGGASAFSLLSGARSKFMMLFATFVMIVCCAKNSNRVRAMQKHIFIVLVGLLCAFSIGKHIYTYSAQKGFLGEKERRKYELQSKEGDALNMLMAGRVEFFVCLYAACQQPLIGRGSWAMDWDGIYPEFVFKYGSEQDYAKLQKTIIETNNLHVIPFHSHIATYWMWHGIFGLLFWLYVLWIVVDLMRKNLWNVPELFGYFIATIPLFLWDLFFSPIGERFYEAVLIVLCILVRDKYYKVIIFEKDLL